MHIVNNMWARDSLNKLYDESKVSLCPSGLRLCMSVFQAIQKTRCLKYACPSGKVIHSTQSSVLCSALHHFRLVVEHILNNRVPHTDLFIKQKILLPNLVHSPSNAMEECLNTAGVISIACGHCLAAFDARLN